MVSGNRIDAVTYNENERKSAIIKANIKRDEYIAKLKIEVIESKAKKKRCNHSCPVCCNKVSHNVERTTHL